MLLEVTEGFRRWVVVVLAHIADHILGNLFRSDASAIALDSDFVIVEFEEDQFLPFVFGQGIDEEHPAFVEEHRGIDQHRKMFVLFRCLLHQFDHAVVDEHHVVIGREFVIIAAHVLTDFVGCDDKTLFIGVGSHVLFAEGALSDSGGATDQNKFFHPGRLYRNQHQGASFLKKLIHISKILYLLP